MRKLMTISIIILFCFSCYEGIEYLDHINGEIVPGERVGDDYIGETYKELLMKYPDLGCSYREEDNISCSSINNEGIVFYIYDLYNNQSPDLNETVYMIGCWYPYQGALEYGTGIRSKGINIKDRRKLTGCEECLYEDCLKCDGIKICFYYYYNEHLINRIYVYSQNYSDGSSK